MQSKVTGDAMWKKRTNGHLEGMSVFFRGDDNVLAEVACEKRGTCNTDQLSFKGLATRWMTGAAQVAPFIHDQVQKLLQASAKGAAKACRGNECGIKWTESFDGKTGIGQQMNALEVMGDLIELKTGKTTIATGGGSSSGTGGGSSNDTSGSGGRGSSATSSGGSSSASSGSGGQAQPTSGQARTFRVPFSSMAVGLIASWILLV